MAHTNNARIYRPKDLSELKKFCKKKHTIIGNQKSYGDCGIGFENNISLINFNKVINLDEKNRTIEVESGMIIKDLIALTLKKNLILKCIPGTKFITIGGMIAANIQGKCSRLNNIKHHIISLKFLNNKNKIINCSKYKNKKYFDLTIGGFGFTGPIISAKFKLKKIQSHNIFQSINTFSTLGSFIKSLKKKNIYEYSFAWIDFIERNFKVILFDGNHSKKIKKINCIKDYNLPNFLIKILSIVSNSKNFFYLINKVFYYKNLFFTKKYVHINNFFFPQDKILNLNKVFYKKGLIQLQFTLKINQVEEILFELRNRLKPYKIFSNFCVLKFLNKNKNINLISLSLDLPIENNFVEIKKILNNIINKFQLNVNLSKDLILENSNTKIINSNPILNEINHSFLSKTHSSQMIRRIVHK
jgi:hypothetical protein